jgi:tetratricopeptide (TPR) repeat protein
MKKLLLGTTILLALSAPAFAQSASPAPAAAPVAAQQDSVGEQIKYLQDEWARIKYQVPAKEAQLDALHKLEDHAAKVSASYQDRAEPKIWEAIILSTEAGIIKGMGALPKVEKAKTLLEQAEKIDSRALDGSAHTSLGSLYYQVPGWPVGFGDDDLAEQHLKKAIQLNPTGIDSNFFYGDFLLQEKRYDEAKTYLERALQAPDRPGRAVADTGRREEIKAALAKISQKKKTEGHSFN